MKPVEMLLRDLDSANLSANERAKKRCELANELIAGGSYEAARGALGEIWSKVNERPKVDGFSEDVKAELLLCVGVLTGFIGSAKSIAGAQEMAKDLISESFSLFEKLGLPEKAALSHAEMAYCYWREGAFDEARVRLEEGLKLVGETRCDVKAVIVTRQAIIEIATKNYRRGLELLRENRLFINSIENHTIKGNYHQNLGIILKNLSVIENNEEFRDQALIEYAAASYHFEKSGHQSYRARVENNLGYVFLTAKKFDESHEHLNRARRLFLNLKDTAFAAQVDETQARVYLEQGKNFEAEKLARAAITVQEKGDELALLSESLITHGKALARLQKHVEAKMTLNRAAQVAESAGASEDAANAYLTIIEEVGHLLSDDELLSAWENADLHFSEKTYPEMLQRLRTASRRLLINRRVAALELSSKEFIHSSAESVELLRRAQVVARADCTVLLTGETGTGKEVLAGLIHKWSERQGEFVAINCAAIPENLMESELFGHQKGSFTDALSDYQGAVKHATGGTLFLDEVGELSLSSQAKILRLIENKEVHTIGATKPEAVNVRIIAATNRDLGELSADGRFRKDLLYRLQVFNLNLKPLRERAEDIEALALHFIHDAVHRYHKRVKFTREAVVELRQLPLQGNARELRALVESTILMSAEGATITAEAVKSFAIRSRDNIGLTIADPWASCSLETEVLSFEEQLIKLALDKSGNVTGAAKLLGVTHQRLSSILSGRHKHLREGLAPRKDRQISIINTKNSATAAKRNRAKV